MPTRQPSRVGDDLGRIFEDLAKLIRDVIAGAIELVREAIESGSRVPEEPPRYGGHTSSPAGEWSKEGLTGARESGLAGDDLADWALGNMPENVEVMDRTDGAIERARQAGSDVGRALHVHGFRPLSEAMADLDDDSGG